MTKYSSWVGPGAPSLRNDKGEASGNISPCWFSLAYASSNWPFSGRLRRIQSSLCNRLEVLLGPWAFVVFLFHTIHYASF
ncbi:hypothetical protein HDF16_002902 [Granulicella aggregans]|uniref:Uncharacterized protein n=1 Tax=Granulicella aggregans TaxID=474949 RepID=A0A7W8E3P1_9BACT|nr:hypothetical protein [Granulicella aggregans]